MQDEKTLEELGFIADADTIPGVGKEWRFKGEHKTFIARQSESGSLSYVSLYEESDKIDQRPLSRLFGKPLRNTLGCCGSTGSVERRMKEYDRPTPA